MTYVRTSPYYPQSNGKIDVNVVSDRTAPISGKIRTRLMDFTGKTLLDSTQAVTVAPLSSAAYVALDEQNLLVNADPHKVFLVVDFAGENGASSQNTLFFDHLKALDLPANSRIESLWNGTSLTLRSASLARHVYLSFGDLDVQLSDNYFDLLPGEPVTITVKTQTPDQLKSALKITQVTDAFTTTTEAR